MSIIEKIKQIFSKVFNVNTTKELPEGRGSMPSYEDSHNAFLRSQHSPLETAKGERDDIAQSEIVIH